MAKHAKHALDPEVAEELAAGEETIESEEDEAALDADATAKATSGAHAKGFMKQEDEDPSGPIDVVPESVVSESKQEIPAHQKKSRRMRVALTVLIVVLVALIAGLALFGYGLVSKAHDVADEVATKTEVTEAEFSDASTVSAQSVEVPQLTALLGLTQKQAVSQLGDGAKVASEKKITKTTGKKKNKKTKVLGKNVTVVLPGGSSEKAPTVYLTINKKGKVTEAGFSAPLSSLGYGNVSFSDAVSEEHAVENLMTAAGIPLEEDAVKLPNSKKYRTYAEDGKTISQEQYTFTGKNKDAAGKKRAWSCRLNYDYSAANVSGNLADTIRQAYLSVEA